MESKEYQVLHMEYQAKAGSLAEASPSDSLSRMDGNNE